MPKPFEEKAGSGMHFHISLWEDGKSLFFKNKKEISDMAKHFISGILTFAPEIALATNGTVNSYKRLVLGYEAPVYILWGYSNRSALVRIPKYKDFEPNTTRIEVRSLDGLNNHYLACAALIKAGLIGVEKELDISLPYQKNAYELTQDEVKMMKVEVLPRNLKTAIENAKNGKILKELLNENFNRFIEMKEREWKEYCKYLESKNLSIDTREITEWEKNRYFLM